MEAIQYNKLLLCSVDRVGAGRRLHQLQHHLVAHVLLALNVEQHVVLELAPRDVLDAAVGARPTAVAGLAVAALDGRRLAAALLAPVGRLAVLADDDAGLAVV